MCRLLAVVAAEPRTVAAVVDEESLRQFVSLTRIHGDGWGAAQVAQPGAVPEVEVSAGSAVQDERFADLVHHRAARASVLHLRWASSGLPVSPENSHPFLTEEIAFAHNGSLRPFELLDDLVDDEARAAVRGTTDSERYFAVVRQQLRDTPDLATATLLAVRRLREVYPVASLNALVMDSRQLVAVHASSRSVLPDEDLADLGQADLPGEHLEDYFGLRWARPDPGTLVIGSTGFGTLDWQPLPAESVTAVDLADRSMSTRSLVAD
jgi:predicted glutamine amidotransferase